MLGSRWIILMAIIFIYMNILADLNLFIHAYEYISTLDFNIYCLGCTCKQGGARKGMAGEKCWMLVRNFDI